MAMLMIFALSGCGGGSESGTAPNNTDTENTQPVESIEESSFSPASLSAFGLPEPSFKHSYSHYSETTIGGDDNGNAILRPRFFYDIECDVNEAYDYMKVLKKAGFDGYLPDELPQLSGDDWLNYEFHNHELRFFISWHTSGQHRFNIVDKTKRCSYNDETSIYIIDGVGDYESYGPHSYCEQ